MSVSMVCLFAAIGCEVVATTALKSCESFSKPLPSLIVLVGYAATLFLFSEALKEMNVGIAYAIWAGLGIVLVTASSAVLFHQSLDAWGIVGITLILVGVAVLNVLSKATLAT